MQDSTQDQLVQLQQTIKKEREREKEKACLGRNLLVQGKESHIKLPLFFFPPFAGFIYNSLTLFQFVYCIGSFIKIFWV